MYKRLYEEEHKRNLPHPLSAGVALGLSLYSYSCKIFLFSKDNVVG